MSLDEDIDRVVGEEVDEKRVVLLKGLRSRILNGESSGNEVRDFIIVVMQVISPDVEGPYYRLLEQVMKGVPVLVERSMRYLKGFSVLCPQEIAEKQGEVRTRLQYAIASDVVRLDREKGGLIVPCDAYQYRFNDGLWMKNNGALFIDAEDVLFYGKRASLTGEARGLVVVTGAEVREFYCKNYCPRQLTSSSPSWMK